MIAGSSSGTRLPVIGPELTRMPGPSDVGGDLGLVVSSSELRQQRMLRGEDHEGRAPDGVGPGGEDLQCVICLPPGPPSTGGGSLPAGPPSTGGGSLQLKAQARP